MFKELEPLLAKRSLAMIVAAVEGGHIRVTVNPMAIKDSSSEIKDKIVPLSIEGTAEELDSGLAASLASYSTEHVSLDNSMSEMRAEIEAVRKEAKEEADKKRAEMRKTYGAHKVKPAAQPAEKPIEQKKSEPPALFAMNDAPAPAPAAAAVQSAPSASNSNTSTSTPEKEDATNGDHSQAAVA